MAKNEMRGIIMDNRPGVTVLMPSLNVRPYIEKCMDSVVCQTLKDIEIICIDAGSTDGTLEILRSYAQKDERIRIILSDKKSYGYQMNLGLDAANGEYIGIVETDDFVKPDMFEVYYRTARQSGAEVVKSDYFYYWENRREQVQLAKNLTGLPYNEVVSPKEYPLILLKNATIWSQLYSRDFLRGFDIRFTETPGASYQDTAFNIKVWLSAERVVFLREGYLYYRSDNEGASVRSGGKVFCVCDEFAEVENFLRSRPEQRQMYESLKCNQKYRSYKWNLGRLALEYKYAFLIRMRDELKEAVDAGCYDRTLFTDEQWQEITSIINDMDGYFGVRGRDDGELERIKNSASYRVGQAVTYIPRKIRNMVRRYR